MRVSLAILAATAAVLVGAPAAAAWVWPVGGPVLRPFVYDAARPYAGAQHRGADIGAVDGEDVRAPAGGRITFAGTVPASGRSVTIETPDGLSLTLVQLGRFNVRRGDVVQEGSVVGTAGASDDAEWARPYVHFGVRVTSDKQGYLDPLGFLRSRPVAAPPPPAAGVDPTATGQPPVAAPAAMPDPAAEPPVTPPIAALPQPTVAPGPRPPAPEPPRPSSVVPAVVAPVAVPGSGAGATRRVDVPSSLAVPGPASIPAAAPTPLAAGPRAGLAPRAEVPGPAPASVPAEPPVSNTVGAAPPPVARPAGDTATETASAPGTGGGAPARVGVGAPTTTALVPARAAVERGESVPAVPAPGRPVPGPVLVPRAVAAPSGLTALRPAAARASRQRAGSSPLAPAAEARTSSEARAIVVEHAPAARPRLEPSELRRAAAGTPQWTFPPVGRLSRGRPALDRLPLDRLAVALAVLALAFLPCRRARMREPAPALVSEPRPADRLAAPASVCDGGKTTRRVRTTCLASTSDPLAALLSPPRPRPAPPPPYRGRSGRALATAHRRRTARVRVG